MSTAGGNGLRRTSSLVLSSPTKSSTPAKRHGKSAVEIVPDSEEERQGGKGWYTGEIIELSSESDGDRSKELLTGKGPGLVDHELDPFLNSPSKHGGSSYKPSNTVIQETESDDDSDSQPHYNAKSSKSRRTIISDSENDSETDIANETDIEADDDDADGAVLVFNDPPSSRKPAARDVATPSKPKEKRPPVAPLVHSTPSGGHTVVADPSPVQTPVLPRLTSGGPSTQARLPDFFASKVKPGLKSIVTRTGEAQTPSSQTAVPMTAAPSKFTTRRKTKKALQQEKQAQLAAYAQALFNELNASVFKGRLHKDTPLVWNNRLLATAGRAKWHRDSKGIVTTSIELATKVLDCEERIRNTLSHEMCHLACWVINCNPKENHGGVWRGWVDEVMDKRPDIVITTKHSYDISYKYEWQCQTATCKKIYGRHSNSIDPTKSICGVCKVGDLVPLFQTRTRKTKATGKMAAYRMLESPLPFGTAKPTPSHLKAILQNGAVGMASDPGSDRETLSGTETDVDDNDDCAVVIESKGFSPTKMELGSAHDNQIQQKGKVDVKNNKVTDDIRKLVTYMSIIDLTDD